MHGTLAIACTIFYIISTLAVNGVLMKNQLTEENHDHHTNRVKRSRVCYGSHGCFSWKGHFYHILKRPIMYNPYFKTDNMKYALYTQENKDTPHFLKISDIKSLNASVFNPNRPSKILTHCWTQLSWFKSPFKTAAPAWMWELKDALLDGDDVNVIILDWTAGSDYHYMKAAPNARLAGADIALMVKYLQRQTGARPEDFHIIGHGLGAHVAGYAGTRLKQMGYTLGRISGLDPVKRYFQGMPDSVHLDQSDAHFVDVIHTNGDSLGGTGIGMIEPSGHLDFYVNGGKSQPGCNMNSCSHRRAYELFVSSAKNLCLYQARLCYGTSHFQASYQCGDRNITMGYLADKAQLRPGEELLSLYLRTERKTPYCQIPTTAPSCQFAQRVLNIACPDCKCKLCDCDCANQSLVDHSEMTKMMKD